MFFPDGRVEGALETSEGEPLEKLKKGANQSRSRQKGGRKFSEGGNDSWGGSANSRTRERFGALRRWGVEQVEKGIKGSADRTVGMGRTGHLHLGKITGRDGAKSADAQISRAATQEFYCRTGKSCLTTTKVDRRA